MANPEMGVSSPEQESKESLAPEYKVGDIIDLAGKKVRIEGFTAPKEHPGRALMTKELSAEELEKHKQREEIIMGKIIAQIEANPNATVDIEQAKKFWGRMYDEAGQGDKLEMQINEIYAKRYEENARLAMKRMLKLEEEANNAKTEAEKQMFLAKIVEEREFAQEMEEEAKKRRNY